MRVEHVAIYVRDLERSRAFFVRWFGATSNARYDSRNQPGLSTYFLSFPGGGARIELMTRPTLTGGPDSSCSVGYAHLAVAVPTRSAVDALVSGMRTAGVEVRSAPRITGDGYYEAVIADPDGNAVEIVAEL